MPMPEEGATGFCSERCLNWDFFGVPALERDDFLSEIRENQRRTEMPDDWARPSAYPGLDDEFCREITEAIGLLNQLDPHA